MNNFNLLRNAPFIQKLVIAVNQEQAFSDNPLFLLITKKCPGYCEIPGQFSGQRQVKDELDQGQLSHSPITQQCPLIRRLRDYRKKEKSKNEDDLQIRKAHFWRFGGVHIVDSASVQRLDGAEAAFDCGFSTG